MIAVVAHHQDPEPSVDLDSAPLTDDSVVSIETDRAGEQLHLALDWDSGTARAQGESLWGQAAVVNPDRVRSQLERAVIMGISLATLGEITFKRGRSQQDSFHQYRVTRMDTAPKDIRVHLLLATDWNMPLGGVGEPGVPPVAPVLSNAIFAATGRRIRRMLIREQAGAVTR